MWRFAAILLSVSLYAQTADAQQASKDTASLRAKAMAFLTKDNDGDNPKISLKLVDLNGDGIPEGLAVVNSQMECGSHGCAAYVLDLSGPTARSIGDFIAFDVVPLKSKTGPWLDISINGHRQKFHAGKYG